MFTIQKCETIYKEYQFLQSQYQEIKEEFGSALRARDFKEIRRLQQALRQRIKNLKEILNPIEKILHLKEQYQKQVEMLRYVGIVEELPTGELGIKGIDGKEYKIPSYEEVLSQVEENKELLKRKYEQGFTLFLLVPFGMKLNFLVGKLVRGLLRYAREGKLQAGVNLAEPARVLGGWYSDDGENPTMLYFPRCLPSVIEESEKEKRKTLCQGKTKQEIMDTQGAWQLLFVEDIQCVPLEPEKPKEIQGGRPKLNRLGTSIKDLIAPNEKTPSPQEYLLAIQSKEIYQPETGFTPEDWITLLLSYVDQKGRVLDDVMSNSFLGAYCYALGYVPGGHWNGDGEQVALHQKPPKFRSENLGVRTGVRLMVQ